MEPRIDQEPQILQPGPHVRSLLMRQPHHRSEDIWNGEDAGALTCRGRTKEMANIQMQDNRVIDIIKLLRLEGLFRAPSREIDNFLITALVERWRRRLIRFIFHMVRCQSPYKMWKSFSDFLLTVRSWLGRLPC